MLTLEHIPYMLNQTWERGTTAINCAAQFYRPLELSVGGSWSVPRASLLWQLSASVLLATRSAEC